MTTDNLHRRLTASVGAGWNEGGSFLGSVIAGTLLGHGLDRWIGTTPWFLVVGLGLGAYSGFLKLYRMSEAVTIPARTLGQGGPDDE